MDLVWEQEGEERGDGMDLRKPKISVLELDNELSDTQERQKVQEFSIDKFMKYDVSITEQ